MALLFSYQVVFLQKKTISELYGYDICIAQINTINDVINYEIRGKFKNYNIVNWEYLRNIIDGLKGHINDKSRSPEAEKDLQKIIEQMILFFNEEDEDFLRRFSHSIDFPFNVSISKIVYTMKIERENIVNHAIRDVLMYLLMWMIISISFFIIYLKRFVRYKGKR